MSARPPLPAELRRDLVEILADALLAGVLERPDHPAPVKSFATLTQGKRSKNSRRFVPAHTHLEVGK